ncbi:hypothetical protein B0H10DRAFT_2230039 [Mycena sp. CBHHK59/15]|nr:hypothetical protein B0H10DRAFT_2230039 [Mycena sp. CBHHK59/15]
MSRKRRRASTNPSTKKQLAPQVVKKIMMRLPKPSLMRKASLKACAQNSRPEMWTSMEPMRALNMICKNVEWLTPIAMLPSAAKLLEEHGDNVDIFKPEDIPEGVEMLCWGMKKVAGLLKGKIIEIGVDATYNTNSKDLELYSIMGDLVNQSRETQEGPTAWAKCLRNTYGVIAQFTHVDKDMAEIGMLKDVRNAKITKLVTTLYDLGRGNAEFPFIDITFVPKGQADGGEYEGGVHDSITPLVPMSQQPHTFTTANGLCITIPAHHPLAAASKSNAIEMAAGNKSDVVGVCVDSTHVRPTSRVMEKHRFLPM